MCLLASASARLLLPSEPPRGFNSFDRYHFDELNETRVLALADAMAAQLKSSGFNLFTLDGGWTDSKLANGTRYVHFDAYARPIAAPERYPSGMRWLGRQLRKRGLKLGLWTIRGVHVDAVRRKLPVLGAPGHTVDELVDEQPVGSGANGSCLWAKEWLGVNMSHPAARAYYESRVALLADEYEADFIKADCMMYATAKRAEGSPQRSCATAQPRV